MSFPTEPTAENGEEETMSRSATPTPNNSQTAPDLNASENIRARNRIPAKAYGFLIDMGIALEQMKENNRAVIGPRGTVDNWKTFRKYLEELGNPFGFQADEFFFVWDPEDEVQKPCFILTLHRGQVLDENHIKKVQKALRTTQGPQWYAIDWEFTLMANGTFFKS